MKHNRSLQSGLLVALVVGVMALTSCYATPHKSQVNRFVLQQLDNMAFVKQGSFLMGPGKKEHQWASGNNQPQQPVTLSSYYMAKYLVTWGNYDFYTTSNNLPRLVKDGYKYKMFWRSPQHPATNMNWQSASNYCHYLAKKSGLPFTLPTEAQWEYAARNRGQNVDDATNTGTSIYGKNTPNAQQIMNQPGHVDDSHFSNGCWQIPTQPTGPVWHDRVGISMGKKLVLFIFNKACYRSTRAENRHR